MFLSGSNGKKKIDVNSDPNTATYELEQVI